jgi:hypothetical protein
MSGQPVNLDVEGPQLAISSSPGYEPAAPFNAVDVIGAHPNISYCTGPTPLDFFWNGDVQGPARPCTSLFWMYSCTRFDDSVTKRGRDCLSMHETKCQNQFLLDEAEKIDVDLLENLK